MNHFVIISGCSGGGKSTLLDELKQRGYPVVPEAGRRIVQEEMQTGGQALPWIDMAAFLHRAIALAHEDHRTAPRDSTQWVFFDRSVIDLAAALQASTGTPVEELTTGCLYHHRVFLTPPWPEIYRQDAERRHDMNAAQEEFERLQRAYPATGYTLVQLPRMSVAQRADFVLETLDSSTG
ncbi:AAA family ATPase [Kerstersia gyiorum]|uniref:AAA family ATPase n=1 Tax=Kerstersia gyiorum TaxID=206506 RepID=UPI00209C9722|nr:AAA family ATPase [Kerstersia gyiorum]MCP1634583.1 putative ATPase [Kerstersia gyiorum]MCP1637059.1 putative ATPase [Kerstersia gyiorum]MCP1670535.1 putative ATPase [Kerstersia gyiorum]MCP1678811.1 putative ATPase [Kerstersia gyiorum]MCP1683812.1 putative ATPase [Kerstersia gyiorum]